MYLIEGPVGAGKSTFSKDLSQKIGAPYMSLGWFSTKAGKKCISA